MYNDLAINHVNQLTNLLSLRFVQTVAGYGWSASHRQNCPARGKNLKNCGIANHFAKVCRKLKHPYNPKPRVNNVDDSVSEVATVGPSTTAAKHVNNIDRLLQKQGIYDANYDSDYDDYDDNYVATISIKSDTREMEPVNLDICVGNTKTKAFGGFGKRVHDDQKQSRKKCGVRVQRKLLGTVTRDA